MNKQNYEAWRISFQSSEQAAKSAYDLLQIAIAESEEIAADSYWKGYVAGGDDFRQGVSLGFVVEKASELVAKLYPNSEVARKIKEQHQC